MRRMLWGAYIVCFLLASPTTVPAQGDDIAYRSYTFETESGNFTLDVPTEWQINDNALGFDFVDFRDRPLPEALPTAMVEMVVLSPEQLNLNPITENGAFEYFDSFRTNQIEASIGIYDAPVAVLFGNEDNALHGVLMTFIDTDPTLQDRMDATRLYSIGIGISLPDGRLLIANFQTDADQVQDIAPIFEHMLSTLMFNDIALYNTTVDDSFNMIANVETLSLRYDDLYTPQPQPTIDAERTFSITNGEHVIEVPALLGWERINYISPNRVTLIAPRYARSPIPTVIDVYFLAVQPTLSGTALQGFTFDWGDYITTVAILQRDAAWGMAMTIELANNAYLVLQFASSAEDTTDVFNSLVALGSGLLINGEALDESALSTAMIQVQFPAE